MSPLTLRFQGYMYLIRTLQGQGNNHSQSNHADILKKVISNSWMCQSQRCSSGNGRRTIAGHYFSDSRSICKDPDKAGNRDALVLESAPVTSLFSSEIWVAALKTFLTKPRVSKSFCVNFYRIWHGIEFWLRFRFDEGESVLIHEIREIIAHWQRRWKNRVKREVLKKAGLVTHMKITVSKKANKRRRIWETFYDVPAHSLTWPSAEIMRSPPRNFPSRILRRNGNESQAKVGIFMWRQSEQS